MIGGRFPTRAERPCAACAGTGGRAAAECWRCHGSGIHVPPLRCYCCGKRAVARLCDLCLADRCPRRASHGAPVDRGHLIETIAVPSEVL